MEIDFHFVRERIAAKLLDVRFIGTEDQVADGFTKALTIRKLMKFRYNLNLEQFPLRGDVEISSPSSGISRG